MSIYALLCKNNKYYIGKSGNVEKRFVDHKSGRGAIWTKIYRPIEILEQFESKDPFDEDKTVKRYMLAYGIENVRGGSYCQIKLESYQLNSLKREIWHASGKCLRCGKPGHFINKCKEEKDVDENLLPSSIIL